VALVIGFQPGVGRSCWQYRRLGLLTLPHDAPLATQSGTATSTPQPTRIVHLLGLPLVELAVDASPVLFVVEVAQDGTVLASRPYSWMARVSWFWRAEACSRDTSSDGDLVANHTVRV